LCSISSTRRLSTGGGASLLSARAHVALVGAAQQRRQHHGGQRLADDFRALPAQQAFRLQVPLAHHAARIERDEGVVRVVEDRPQFGRAFLQQLLGAVFLRQRALQLQRLAGDFAGALADRRFQLFVQPRSASRCCCSVRSMSFRARDSTCTS
jgi:hypothetical protein